MKIIARIPEALYKKIYAHVPILCVEALAVDGQGNFLLIKRKSDPMAGLWWLPGGRLYRGETLARGALRTLQQETGLKGRIMKQLGTQDGILATGHFKGMSCHTPVVGFLVRVAVRSRVRLDIQSSEYQWFRKINPRWNTHVKFFLRQAGFH